MSTQPVERQVRRLLRRPARIVALGLIGLLVWCLTWLARRGR